MIPKKIHYCWFGGNPLPAIATKCMESWQRFCPDYEIIRWDETNCDITVNQFVEQAYEAKKWAFVSDYFRLKIVEEHGGIYLDIDVELLKPLDDLLILNAFMGFELGGVNLIATGLGFGATPFHPLVTALRENYENSPFVKPNGEFDTLPCPQRDTKVLVEYGLQQNNQKQIVADMTFFPSDYFSPIGFYGEKNFSNNTYSIHHFNASWFTARQRIATDRVKKLRDIFGVTLGNKINLLFLGWEELKYNGVKALIIKLIKFFELK